MEWRNPNLLTMEPRSFTAIGLAQTILCWFGSKG
jgi:hypothetical protein